MGRVIFFDMDDTLYERFVPFCNAYREFFGNADPSEAAARRAFVTTQQRCEEVFLPSKRGEITREEMFIYRYQKGFADVGIEIGRGEALQFRDVYQKWQGHLELTPATAAMLDRCRTCYDGMGVITNGPGPHQRAKMHSLGLEKWMDEKLIIISGEVGIDKPDPKVFALAAERAGVGPSEITYVGDSVSTDITPAQQAGWNAVLWRWDRAAEIAESLI